MIPRRIIRGFQGNWRPILAAILSGKAISESKVEKFETKFGHKFNLKYNIATSSGRQALMMILKSLELPIGSEVLIPAYNLKSLFTIIQKLGYKPIAVDINRYDLNISIDDLKNKISNESKCLIITHMFGIPCDLDAITSICIKNNLPLIEDCAHAHGTLYKGKNVGTFGYAALFSFDSVKPLSTIFGGMIATDNINVFHKIVKIRNSFHKPNLFFFSIKFCQKIFEHFILSSLLYNFFAFIFKFESFKRFFNKAYIGVSQRKSLTSKMINLQAIIGLRELDSFDDNFQLRKQHSQYLSSRIKLNFPHAYHQYQSSYYFLVAFDPHQNAKDLQKKLLKNGIDTHYGDELASLCHIDLMQDAPNTDWAYRSLIQIPNHERLNSNKLMTIINVINATFNDN